MLASSFGWLVFRISVLEEREIVPFKASDIYVLRVVITALKHPSLTDFIDFS